MATLNKIKVNQAQAADPGIAFSLTSLDENGQPVPFNCGLLIRIQIATTWPGGTYTYESDVTIWNPVMENSIVFAVPYGDPNFGSETNSTYNITIQVTQQGQNGSQSGFSDFSNIEAANAPLPRVGGAFVLSQGSISF